MSDAVPRPGGDGSGGRPARPHPVPAGFPAVEMVDVHKDFDGGMVRALNGLTLQVGVGESVAVTGPSGCGKSTMLHLIAALDTPTSGVIRVGGVDLAEIRDVSGYRRRRIGLVFQLHNLLPQLSAIQNVEVAMFGTGRGPRARRARAAGLLADLDLAGLENRPPTKLSGGERQRVAIARALANDPEVLLADEPTGSLDERSVERVLDLLSRLRAARPAMTVVVVTHDPRVASTADRVIRLRDGRVDDASSGQPPRRSSAVPGG